MKTYIKINDKVWGTYLSRNYIGLKDIKVLNHRVTPNRSSRKDVLKADFQILRMKMTKLGTCFIFLTDILQNDTFIHTGFPSGPAIPPAPLRPCKINKCVYFIDAEDIQSLLSLLNLEQTL